MSITDGYCTLQELKDWKRLTSNTDDATLEAIITAVSRSIDSVTGHNFYTQASATARVYAASQTDLLEVHDFYETASLVIKSDEDANGSYETTWASTDYQLEPLNGIALGRAVWRIRARAYGNRRFLVSSDALVQVTAKWGWVSVPQPVKQACLILANRMANRRDSPLGMIQSPDLGTNDRLASFDPDVSALLRPYTKFETPL